MPGRIDLDSGRGIAAKASVCLTERLANATAAVAPEDVGAAVAVKIADGSDLPVGAHLNGDGRICGKATVRLTKRLSDSAEAVAPQDVRTPVPVEITDRSEGIGRAHKHVDSGRAKTTARLTKGFTQVTMVVAPQDVAKGIPVKVVMGLVRLYHGLFMSRNADVGNGRWSQEVDATLYLLRGEVMRWRRD